MKQTSLNKQELKKILGQNLKKLRKRAGISQVEFGGKLGLRSSGSISLIENGTRGLTLENLFRASQVLKVPLIALIAPGVISDEQVDVYKDITTIFSEPKDPDIIRLVKSALKLAASHRSFNILENKIKELETMGIDLEYLIEGVLKSKKI